MEKIVLVFMRGGGYFLRTIKQSFSASWVFFVAPLVFFDAMKSCFYCSRVWIGAFVLLVGMLASVQAQWQTQSFVLKPGWNAVYLHVDASHVSLDDLILVPNGAPISDVWLWQPAVSTAQFTTTPQQTSVPNSQWAVWDHSPVVVDSLTRLYGNGAYLVRNRGSVDYTWNVLGKPVPPRYDWTTSGLNFIGFPTPASTPPTWDLFLTPVPNLQRTVEIYRYPGGELGATNPVRVLSPKFRSVTVKRGEAVWIRATNYNRYFGPVSVDLPSASGIDFSDSRGTYSLRLKNQTATARTVTMDLLVSETPPAGQAAITGTPPMLVRGALNTTNLTYAHSELTSQKSFTLTAQGQPGSELEIVLGLNRSAMVASAGSLYAGILRLADTGGLSQIDLPITATVANTAGLWVGDAMITQVGQYLKTYQKGADGQPVLAAFTAAGAPYVATATNTSLGVVAQPYRLRLILMADARDSEVIRITNTVTTVVDGTSTDVITVTNGVNLTTNSVLLQRVYFGPGVGANMLVATSEALLDPARLEVARRISSTHLPYSEANTSWSKTSGEWKLGTNMIFNVTLDYKDQASNPFLHTFHPDHDNLDVKFAGVEVQGAESYTVTRAIKLSFNPPAGDFASLTAGTGNFGGVYSEVMTFYGKGSHAREFSLSGVFSLNRMSQISTLTKK